jgi:mRNA interferase RelE/StbE
MGNEKAQYAVRFTERAKKQLYKLDKQHFYLITNWIAKNIENCENPRQHGKALSANRAGQWRYRVGDYRIIAKIDDNIVTIFVLELGH